MTATDIVPPDLDAAIAALPVEALRQLGTRRFSDAALRQQGLNQRDAAYRGLAALLPPAGSGYAIALAIRAKLRRYRDGPWRFEPGREAPSDPVRALMHRILTLDRGKIRSRHTIERALSGTRSKSPERMSDTRPHGQSDQLTGCGTCGGDC